MAFSRSNQHVKHAKMIQRPLGMSLGSKVSGEWGILGKNGEY